MRILFFEDPLPEPGELLWQVPHIERDLGWLKALRFAGCDARMIIGARLARYAEADDLPADAIIRVEESQLTGLLANPQTNVNALFHRCYEALVGGTSGGPQAVVDSPRAEAELREAQRLQHESAIVFERSLGGFDADVVITWTPAPHLRLVFPEALILHKETALFSRTPFAASYYLDPFGFLARSAPGRGCSMAVAAATASALAELKAYFARLFDLTDEIDAILPALSGFERTVMVGGQRAGSFMFEGACSYRSQAEMFLDVLTSVPRDWGVIVTEHPGGRMLSSPEIAYFAERFPNFVHVRPRSDWRQVGQHLLRHVDGVATVSSTIGFQAALWNKPLAALGRSVLNRWSQAHSALEIPASLARQVDMSEVAAWLCFHYSYQDAIALQPGWLAGHLEKRLADWRATAGAGYFDEPLFDPEEARGFAMRGSRALLKSHLGLNARSDGIQSVDFRSPLPFRSGWGAAEFGSGLHYRWVIGTSAVLALCLEPESDQRVTMRIGSLAEIGEQRVSVGIDDLTLGTSTIVNGQPVEMSLRIPANQIVAPATFFWIRASAASPHAPDTRLLSLIVLGIDVAKDPPGAAEAS